MEQIYKLTERVAILQYELKTAANVVIEMQKKLMTLESSNKYLKDKVKELLEPKE
jgi:hypothetical protein